MADLEQRGASVELDHAVLGWHHDIDWGIVVAFDLPYDKGTLWEIPKLLDGTCLLDFERSAYGTMLVFDHSDHCELQQDNPSWRIGLVSIVSTAIVPCRLIISVRMHEVPGPHQVAHGKKYFASDANAHNIAVTALLFPSLSALHSGLFGAATTVLLPPCHAH